MIKLAYNDKAVLIKGDGHEYWYIQAGFKYHGCYEEQSECYKALNALESFEKQFGPATWTHERIVYL